MRDFLIGIAPGHAVALVCALLTPPLLLLAWRIVRGHAALGARWARKLAAGWDAAAPTERWAAWLLAVVAVVHLTLPLGPDHSGPLTVGFLLSGAAAARLAVRAVTGRRWRVATVVLLVAVLCAYTVNSIREEADQVGLATAVIELAVLALAAQRAVARLGLVLLTFCFGTAMWLTVLAGHEGDGGHAHGEHLARAQAGIVQRPGGGPPTPAQARAAEQLAQQVKAATAKYRDVALAEADGYVATGPRTGLQAHLEHKGHQRDGRVVDPAAPEQLVYAFEGDRAVLLGVVFQMPVAGVPGPRVGGSATRWHAHNVCVGLLPPGFGVVSPFGTCPGLTVSLTIAEMIHVWVVDPPGGPFAENIDDAWVRGLLP